MDYSCYYNKSPAVSPYLNFQFFTLSFFLCSCFLIFIYLYFTIRIIFLKFFKYSLCSRKNSNRALCTGAFLLWKQFRTLLVKRIESRYRFSSLYSHFFSRAFPFAALQNSGRFFSLKHHHRLRLL